MLFLQLLQKLNIYNTSIDNMYRQYIQLINSCKLYTIWENQTICSYKWLKPMIKELEIIQKQSVQKRRGILVVDNTSKCIHRFLKQTFTYKSNC